ncbi:TetR/AcrR family transcriptional regulator [Massilibacteroides vaginae]|uniref:TetR/AcrR family transcriptional regulator n=1 Tax=Massilibacteroides vaginae TaxID=1673718 RepID=UPI000A1CC2E6|nr:TetR/AcrR family transcriptional regulator [Massilibacteroides vaginae]
MDKKEIIIDALNLFSRYGVKGVSMDQIARNSNISKRTLYEYFEDKGTLLSEALEYNYIEHVSLIKRLEKDSESVIDLFYYFYEKIMEMPRWYSPKFYDDLKKYPEVREAQGRYKEFFHEIFSNWFKRGVEEGVFVGDVNFEILILMSRSYSKMIRPSQSFSQFSSREVYTTIVLVFLRGICTAKGNERLERHIRKKRFDLSKN